MSAEEEEALLPSRRERKIAARQPRRIRWPLPVLLMAAGALVGAAYGGTRVTTAWPVAPPRAERDAEAELDRSRTLDVADVFHLLPGTARSRGAPPDAAPPVMRVERGQLVLDFGAVPAGSEITIPDVLRIANEWREEALVEARLSPEAALFIAGVYITGDRSRVLAPGEHAPMAVRLHVNGDLEPGEYRGAVYIEALGGFAEVSLPAQVRVLPAAARPGP